MVDILLTPEPLDVHACIEKVISPDSGGIDVFIGVVRNETDGKEVVRLEFEAYETMALKELNNIVDVAKEQWPIKHVLIHHRTGILMPGEIPVVIIVSAAHRDAAFTACRFIIDALKQIVPIWKKEVFADGAIWVSAHP